jgi:alpha-galactosidase
MTFPMRGALPAALALFITWAAPSDQDRAPLTTTDPPPNGVWIDALDLTNAPIRRPRAGRGQTTPPPPLTFALGGNPYPHALPLLANTDLAIDLHGQATRFLADVGVDDERKDGQATVIFGVWVDGKKVADSSLMRSGEPPKRIAVDLTGARRLTLAVSDAGDGPRDDSADFGGAVIVMAPGAQRPSIAAPVAETKPAIAPSRTARPRINSPRVTGATPGRPFLFRIPASGDGPLTFTAKGLPAGLMLDPRTGIMTGSLKQASRTVVEVTAKGPAGSATGEITIVGGDDALALTPPLGWNSWNVWGGTVSDEKVRAAADALVKSGLAAQGYTYVNIDDAWEGPRTADGEITTNEKFPNMKALADYVHAQGLKIGIYSSPGPRTCQQRYAGSYQHEAQDAHSYATWGFDYLKYDWCSYTEIEPDRNNPAGLKKPYLVMRDILKTLDRDIVFSLCQYGWGNVWEWGNEVGGHLWRMTGDITDTWPSMAGIGFAQTGREKFAGPGGWNDTDMLVVGKVGWGRELRDSRLTANEQLTHISLWSLQAAPLLIGADLSQIDAFTVDLLGNSEVLAVNQDPLGRPAGRVSGDGWFEVWARPLADGTTAVGLFNRSPEAAPVVARWSDLKLTGAQPVRDLWQQKDLGTSSDQLTATVPRHGVVLVKIGRPRQ